MRIDAHLHLWDIQNGELNGHQVVPIGDGKVKVGTDIIQMMPPYMVDGRNLAEQLLANMDYAGVNGCVVTQEYLDGNQDEYLLSVKKQYPNRFKICSLYEETEQYRVDGFDGIKLCAGKLKTQSLTDTLPVFKAAEKLNKFISIDLAEGKTQVGELEEIIQECPGVKIAIGHFGMVGRKDFEEQIKLARHQNVYVESGGITWLFHKEFYPYPSAIKAIKTAQDICGMEKLMWGSDYPRTMTAITYAMSFDFIEKSKELTQEEKDLFFWKNAAGFYGFENLVEMPRIPNIVED